jgi:hypothetical protein
MDGARPTPPWPLTLALAVASVCGGGYGGWTVALAQEAAAHPALQQAAAASAWRAASGAGLWALATPWPSWLWAAGGLLGLCGVAATFACGALCGTAAACAGGRWWWPSRPPAAPTAGARMRDDSLEAHAALAGQLSAGGPAALRAAAAQLALSEAVLHAWHIQWVAATGGPGPSAIPSRAAPLAPWPQQPHLAGRRRSGGGFEPSA